MTEQTQKNYIMVRVTESFKAELKKQAEHAGFNISNYIRHLIVNAKEKQHA